MHDYATRGRSLPLINTEAGVRGGAAPPPPKLYTIFHQKYELVTQILIVNNKKGSFARI